MTQPIPQDRLAQTAPLAGSSPAQEAERLLRGKPRPANARLSQAQTPYLDHGIETGLMLYFRDSGERVAFELLYRITSESLGSWISMRVAQMGGRTSAEEVLQDAFVNIYRYSQSFRGQGVNGFRRWARTIAANALSRSCRRRAIVFAEWSDGAYEIEGAECDPLIAAQDREQAQRLASAYALVLQWVPLALAQLSSRDRYVLTAIHVHGARYREVEQELGLRSGGLKMIVHRARTRLQLALQTIARG